MLLRQRSLRRLINLIVVDFRVVRSSPRPAIMLYSLFISVKLPRVVHLRLLNLLLHILLKSMLNAGERQRLRCYVCWCRGSMIEQPVLMIERLHLLLGLNRTGQKRDH